MKHTNLILALAAAGGIAALAPTAMAANSEQSEQTLLQSSKVSLADAITLAERQTGGKAFDAGVDAEHGAPRIVVETHGATGTQTVYVDLGTGAITGTHAGGEAD